MVEREWFVWLERYVKRFLAENESRDFIDDHWKKMVMALDFEDAIGAIGDVALDAQKDARFPRHHLHLLLENANERKRKRLPRNPPPQYAKTDEADEAWDKGMFKLGRISKREFDKRQRVREAKKVEAKK